MNNIPTRTVVPERAECVHTYVENFDVNVAGQFAQHPVSPRCEGVRIRAEEHIYPSHVLP